ncbi:MAG: hypothetical protein C0616_14900 [Desulfuromonas sp.]|nr:MAG: hypothetical protein C0616_14900 [Desulfuromonas sp.]
MFKNLKIYYLFVSLPFILLLVGAAAFYKGIWYTLARNPHPQINYTIFTIILVGGVLILLNSRRLIGEAKSIIGFFAQHRAKKDAATLQKVANEYTGETACLLQMVATSTGRSISHQEQVAIEHELTNTRSSLLRRNALPSYLTGLLVGMGLLGTFIGLLATLNDITVLITSFADLDMQNASPLLVFRTMIDRMRAPMQSMGIAFSASMFGLLGSIITGLMMVGLRRLQGDMFSVLSSEVARHIEIALANDTIDIETVGENTGALSSSLIRIEQRYAEAARNQQRSLSSLRDDLQQQRADMQQALTGQNEANSGLRSDLQQLGRQLGSILSVLEQGNSEMSAQVSDLTVSLSGSARETHKLLADQVEEQKQLRDALDSYNIEERLAEAAKHQQRALSTVISDMQQQRDEMLQVLTSQTESNHQSRAELQRLGNYLDGIAKVIEKGDSEISAQISELTVHVAADTQESQVLLDGMSAKLCGELQQLAHQLAQSFDLMEKGNEQIAARVSALMAQAAAEAKGSQEQVDKVSGSFRNQLQQLGSQLGTSFDTMKQGKDEISTKISTMTAQMAAESKTSQEQTDKSGSSLRKELQQLGSQLGASFSLMEKGNNEICTKIAELTSRVSTESKSSHEHLDKTGTGVREELQYLGNQLSTSFSMVEKGHDAIVARIADLSAQMASATKASHELFDSASTSFRSDLQKLGGQVGTAPDGVSKGNGK